MTNNAKIMTVWAQFGLVSSPGAAEGKEKWGGGQIHTASAGARAYNGVWGGAPSGGPGGKAFKRLNVT